MSTEQCRGNPVPHISSMTCLQNTPFSIFKKKPDLLETYLPVEQTGEKDLVHKLINATLT
jgi:hypothetical protein